MVEHYLLDIDSERTGWVIVQIFASEHVTVIALVELHIHRTIIGKRFQKKSVRAVDFRIIAVESVVICRALLFKTKFKSITKTTLTSNNKKLINEFKHCYEKQCWLEKN